jgi:hypothetical protein
LSSGDSIFFSADRTICCFLLGKHDIFLQKVSLFYCISIVL